MQYLYQCSIHKLRALIQLPSKINVIVDTNVDFLNFKTLNIKAQQCNYKKKYMTMHLYNAQCDLQSKFNFYMHNGNFCLRLQILSQCKGSNCAVSKKSDNRLSRCCYSGYNRTFTTRISTSCFHTTYKVFKISISNVCLVFFCVILLHCITRKI